MNQNPVEVRLHRCVYYVGVVLAGILDIDRAEADPVDTVWKQISPTTGLCSASVPSSTHPLESTPRGLRSSLSLHGSNDWRLTRNSGATVLGVVVQMGVVPGEFVLRLR